MVTTGYGAHRVDRIYSLHPSTNELAIAPSYKPLKVIDRLNLGEEVLTVLEGPPTGVIPKIDDQACGRGN